MLLEFATELSDFIFAGFPDFFYSRRQLLFPINSASEFSSKLVQATRIKMLAIMTIDLPAKSSYFAAVAVVRWQYVAEPFTC